MKPIVRLTQVSQVIDLSPHLRRIVLTGDELVGFPEEQQGAHVKVLLPDVGETMPNMKVVGEGAAVPCNTEVFLGLEARQIRTIKNRLLEEREIERCCVRATGYWKKGVDADRFSADKKVNPL